MKGRRCCREPHQELPGTLQAALVQASDSCGGCGHEVRLVEEEEEDGASVNVGELC